MKAILSVFKSAALDSHCYSVSYVILSLKLYDQDGLCLGEGRMSPIDSIYKELALCQVLN